MSEKTDSSRHDFHRVHAGLTTQGEKWQKIGGFCRRSWRILSGVNWAAIPIYPEKRKAARAAAGGSWEDMKKAAQTSGSGGSSKEKPPELIPGGVVLEKEVFESVVMFQGIRKLSRLEKFRVCFACAFIPKFNRNFDIFKVVMDN